SPRSDRGPEPRAILAFVRAKLGRAANEIRCGGFTKPVGPAGKTEESLFRQDIQQCRRDRGVLPEKGHTGGRSGQPRTARAANRRRSTSSWIRQAAGYFVGKRSRTSLRDRGRECDSSRITRQACQIR